MLAGELQAWSGHSTVRPSALPVSSACLLYKRRKCPIADSIGPICYVGLRQLPK